MTPLPDIMERTRAQSFEASMSTLTLAIHQVRRYGPQTKDDVHRLRLLVADIDTITSKAARAVELQQGTGK